MSKYRFPTQIKSPSYHKSTRWKRRKQQRRAKRESLDAIMRS